MANDVIPMKEMFDACCMVLGRKLIPIHYATLTELALNDLGLNKSQVDWPRQIEDVREKMLEKGRFETFYTGYPMCLAGFSWWFQGNQMRLTHPTDGIWIPGSAALGAEGAYEALMRDPYMKIKTHALRPRIARARGRGFVLEKHVAAWFKINWPEFYLSPDNEGDWGAYCAHDFKLCLGENAFEVDISGQKLNGKFGNPGGGKRRVDFHLLCQIVGQDILWHSIFTGKNYDKEVHPSVEGACPQRMVVWLNCLQADLDYSAIKSSVSGILV